MQDISGLKEAETLEGVCLVGAPVENLEVLLELPSLKAVCYEAEEKEQKEVLETLEAKGVIVDSDRERFAETMKQAGIDFIGDAR